MSDCACLYDSAEGDAADFYVAAWRTARKSHRCCECRETIQPGTLYYSYTGKWDGNVRTEKTCAECHEIRATLYCDSRWTFGQLWQDVHEQLFSEGGLTVECIDKLGFASAKDKLQHAWMEYLK